MPANLSSESLPLTLIFECRRRTRGSRSHKSEIDLLTRWIKEGAEWQPHWAFIPPKSPFVPNTQNQRWARNGIDQFVLARLEAEGLSPSAPASREMLIRRAAFDLTGLPPTLDDIDAFLEGRITRGV